ncbi:hypothetical protein, partial [Moritella viscosa]|uniref:hypothetical protein n=1 Tax=Moritella viscosa TaxID=80854 RepID=UPI001BA9CF51
RPERRIDALKIVQHDISNGDKPDISIGDLHLILRIRVFMLNSRSETILGSVANSDNLGIISGV